jgi:hypothetical protein
VAVPYAPFGELGAVPAFLKEEAGKSVSLAVSERAWVPLVVEFRAAGVPPLQAGLVVQYAARLVRKPEEARVVKEVASHALEVVGAPELLVVAFAVRVALRAVTVAPAAVHLAFFQVAPAGPLHAQADWG